MLGSDIFIHSKLVKMPTDEGEERRFQKIAKSYDKNIVKLDGTNLIFPKRKAKHTLT